MQVFCLWAWRSWLLSLFQIFIIFVFNLLYLVYTLLLVLYRERIPENDWFWDLLPTHGREGSGHEVAVSILIVNHVTGAQDWLSQLLPPVLTVLLRHFVSSEGNNKVNTVMLNHFPAYKWAHIKNSILRRAFYRAVTSFGKVWWKTDRLQNNFRPPRIFTSSSLCIWTFGSFKFRNGGLNGGRIRFSDILNIAVVYFN